MKIFNLLLLMLFFNVFAYGQKQKELTFNNVIQYCDSIGMQYKEIVLRQICLESGNLKHKNALRTQNLLGLSRKGRLIKFNHWTESLDFYKNRFQKNISDSSKICYYTYLRKKKYAADPKYISKLKKIKVKKIIYNYEQDTTKEAKENKIICYVD